MYILGFYYFDIEMSHMNPWLFKRLGTMDVEYTLEKGKSIIISRFRFVLEAFWDFEGRDWKM